MKLLLTAVLPLLGAACAPLPPLEVAPVAAADASGPVSVAPVGPTVNYTARSVSDPADWTTLNDEQTEGSE